MSGAAPPGKAAPWRGRPRVADPLDHVVRVRCTGTDLAVMTAHAERAGMTLSHYLRHRGTTGTAGQPRAVSSPKPDRAALARVLAAVGKLGSNVNQMARVANSAGYLPAVAELAGVQADTRAIVDALMRALGRPNGH